MLCFRRFSGRRGVPGMIVSDNAKTFLAANSLFEGYWLVKRLENILKAAILNGDLICRESLDGMGSSKEWLVV